MTTATIAATEVAPKAPVRKAKRALGRDVGIPVRRVEQEYTDDIPDYWVEGNPFLTMFFAGFSGSLPVGEAQFIHSVRLFQDKITDPVLSAQVRAFIGQEGHHAREHTALNDFFVKRGFRVDKIERAEKRLSRLMRKYQSPASQLATTVCVEHLTALLAALSLEKAPEFLASIPEPIRTTWAWHAIEETEHKAVAFDVYEEMVGDREALHRSMVVVTALVLGMNSVRALRLLPRRHWANLKMWRESFSFMRRMIRLSADDYMDFYRSDFHPWDHDNRLAVEAAKERYLGELA